MEQGSVKIISGSLGGRVLRFPHSAVIRPTSARVREAAFSAIGSRMKFAGANVLDLFAGSGALGIEAISRGASTVLFVERDRGLAAAISENLSKLNISDRAETAPADVLKWLKSASGELSAGSTGERRFDLVLADPPYGEGYSEEIPALLLKGNLLAHGGYLFIECGKRESVQAIESAGSRLVLLMERTMGDTRWFLLRYEARE